jgi:hypothetical protein
VARAASLRWIADPVRAARESVDDLRRAAAGDE